MFGNIFNSLQFPESKPKKEEEKQTTGLMSSLRPRARPAGLAPVPPDDDNDDDNKTSKYLANTIRDINNPAYDDEDGTVADPRGTPLNSVDAQQVLLDPNSLHSTYNTRMAQAGADFTVKMQKFRSAEVDSVLNYAEYTKDQAEKAELAQDSMLALAKTTPRSKSTLKAGDPGYVPDKITIGEPGEPFTVEYDTKSVQQNLVDAGYNIAVDGIIGPQTRKAIKEFQKERGITEKGVGAQTARALGFDSAEVKAEVMTSPVPGPDQMQVGFQDPAIVDPTTGKPFVGPAIARGLAESRRRINAATKRQYEQDSLEAKTILEQADPETAPETVPEDRGLGAPTPTSVITATDRKTKQGRIKIQQALKDLNYNVGEVDGVIGPQTEAAIRQFQQDNNLGQDAVVGKNTSVALNEALRSTPKETQEITKEGFLKRFKDFIVSKITPKEVQQVEKLIEQGFNPIDITINYPLVTGETGLLGKGTRGKYITLSDNMETGPESEAFRDTIVKILEDAGAASGIDAKGNVVAWCAAFVDAILHEGDVSRLKGNRLGALAYENYGAPVDSVDAAKQGDIVVLHSRNVAIDRVTRKVVFDSIPYDETDSKYHQEPDKYQIVPGYHVGFYVGEGRADNTFQLLGGNQSNTVSIKSFDMGKIHKIRRLKPEDLNKAIIK